MSSEMIVRVAKALCRRRVQINITFERVLRTKEFIQRAIEVGYPNYLDEAKIVIEAMREPTEAMIEASSDPSIYGRWQDMIDAALKDS